MIDSAANEINLKELKSFSIPRLTDLADEIRKKIIQVCLTNGGHIGASLGAVELAIALHFVFDSPQDPIVWDVGHQAYAHKILTHRNLQFHTMRKLGGISGFLRRSESEHDIFGAGHSSTALSAALGISWAKTHAKDQSWTIAVIGDGSLTAGLSYEALNNILEVKPKRLLIVLNDNQLSISENVGAIPRILAHSDVAEFFKFFGIHYKGPVNGHSLSDLISKLHQIKSADDQQVVLLHVNTIKGKGYGPAEKSPIDFHGVNPNTAQSKSFSQIFGQSLCELAKQDPKVVAITAAMSEGTGLREFKKEFPNRFFDVGIAEAHAVTFAAGLATQGYKPIVAIYSTFLQRALDSIIHDVALQKLGVTFVVDRAGIVGTDGPTHHGAFDLAYLNMIPGMQVLAPSCLLDIKRALQFSIKSGAPTAIRFPRGSSVEDLGIEVKNQTRFHFISNHPKIIVIALGPTALRAEKAILKVDSDGKNISFISTLSSKPISQEIVTYLNKNLQAAVVSIEDGIIQGGFGMSLLRQIHPREEPFDILGYADHFIEQGSISELEEIEGLSSTAISERLTRYLNS